MTGRSGSDTCSSATLPTTACRRPDASSFTPALRPGWRPTPTTYAELDEIAGWHLEQAVRYQRELGQAPDPSLAKRAATHLHAAGNRAGARGDPHGGQQPPRARTRSGLHDDIAPARGSASISPNSSSTRETSRVQASFCRPPRAYRKQPHTPPSPGLNGCGRPGRMTRLHDSTPSSRGSSSDSLRTEMSGDSPERISWRASCTGCRATPRSLPSKRSWPPSTLGNTGDEGLRSRALGIISVRSSRAPTGVRNPGADRRARAGRSRTVPWRDALQWCTVNWQDSEHALTKSRRMIREGSNNSER